jgi:hypothetical protein
MLRVALLTVVATLMLATPATAKEILKVTACGPDHCVTTEDDALRELLMYGGTPGSPPGEAARSIALQATIGDPATREVFGTFTLAWMPDWQLLIDQDGNWMRASTDAERALQGLVDQLGTFPMRDVHRLPVAERELPSADAPARVAPAEPRRAPEPASGSAATWLLIPTAAALLIAALLVVRRRPGGERGPRTATP